MTDGTRVVVLGGGVVDVDVGSVASPTRRIVGGGLVGVAVVVVVVTRTMTGGVDEPAA